MGNHYFDKGSGLIGDDEEKKEVLPGFRFHPTDEELVGFYLRRKVEEKPISIEIIKQIDIYKYDPWDLPKFSNVGDKEWYFFCLRGRKYRNSIRPNRVTGSGFWKATGIDRPIYAAATDECIGLKKSLVYYRGSAGKGTKTDWMMHEFRIPSNNNVNADNPFGVQEAEIWTICRIFKRSSACKKSVQANWTCSTSLKQTPTVSSSNASSLESDETNFRPSVFPATDSNQLQLTGKAPLTAFHPGSLNPSTNELEEGNWDELGRIMGYVPFGLRYIGS